MLAVHEPRVLDQPRGELLPPQQQVLDRLCKASLWFWGLRVLSGLYLGLESLGLRVLVFRDLGGSMSLLGQRLLINTVLNMTPPGNPKTYSPT